MTIGGQTVPYTVEYQSWRHDGSGYTCRLIRADGQPDISANTPVTVTLTPAEGMKTFAMDPITAPITAAAQSAPSSISITGARYDSSQNTLSIFCSGAVINTSIYGCDFQLFNAAGEQMCILRGQLENVYDETGTLTEYQLDCSQIPAVPETGWTLTYQVLDQAANSGHFIVAASGEPMATTTNIPITIA